MVRGGEENGYRWRSASRSIVQHEDTHYIACFQVSPSSEFTADAMLNTSEANQNEFTAF